MGDFEVLVQFFAGLGDQFVVIAVVWFYQMRSQCGFSRAHAPDVQVVDFLDWLASFAEAESYIRQVSAPFGALSDENWRQLTESSLRQTADGRFEMRYDPEQKRVVYEPVSIEMREITPRIVRPANYGNVENA